ncbi:hypothetical protein [Mesorhizobium sp. IMUNJ 23232]|uniref:hypothetical protein n=1 Tax=Mesorhizobium sp. IMUNJ 23232 TaxID=3376064 RepID=UPI00379C0BA4
MPERIAELRSMLLSGRRRRKLDAMEEAALARASAAPLVPDIAPFMTSSDYVPVGEQEYDFSGHAPLAFQAMSTIEAIGVPPDIETLRRLLNDHQLIVVPEACCDQGAYIGDYSSETLSPAGFAARLVPLMGVEGFGLFTELAANARHENDLIADPARRTVVKLSLLGAALTVASIAVLRGEMAAVQTLPEVASPATRRGFALRDMAADVLKNLDREPSRHDGS